MEGSPLSESENPRERRLVLRLLGYWRDLCGERNWPAASDVVSADMEDMWDYSFILDLKGGEPIFRHFGNWQAEFYGADLTGRKVSELARNTLAERSTYYFGEVVRRRIPITYGNEVTEPGGRKILYRSILMPLSDDGTNMTGILGGSNCKLADEAEPA